jgi:hypothetical protein
MKERLFDNNWFNKIKDIAIEGDIKKAEKFLNQYMIKYPNDPHAITLYITICFHNNEIDKAEEYIKNSQDDDTCKRTIQRYHYFYMKGEYEEAYKLLLVILEDKNINHKTDFYKELRFQRCFLEFTLKIDSGITYTGYKANQIINYDRNLAIEHIKTHTYDIEDKARHNKFEDEIDIEQLLEIVEERIKDDIPCYKNETTNKYIFKYPNLKNIEYIEGIQFKYLKVVSIRNTNNVIAMYPIFTINRITSAVPLEREDKKTKVKTLSQIEKFNQRYGK